jgi:alkanesulfonate monooxygenase SsuD/methylene tetrahydromethanopterin reductase-like flavin-dependent oxidoreductase (luciferase family)
LPYAFASHFAPASLVQAIEIYHREFKPSPQLDRPFVAAGVNVFAVDTDSEAQWLFPSAQQQFTRLIRGTRGQLPTPIDEIDDFWTPMERSQVTSMLSCSFASSPQTIRPVLQEFISRTGIDELIVASAIYDHAADCGPMNCWPMLDWVAIDLYELSYGDPS